MLKINSEIHLLVVCLFILVQREAGLRGCRTKYSPWSSQPKMNITRRKVSLSKQLFESTKTVTCCLLVKDFHDTFREKAIKIPSKIKSTSLVLRSFIYLKDQSYFIVQSLILSNKELFNKDGERKRFCSILD